jgi:dTDP-4-dehydrorhamnose 3,5-epimerase
VRFEPTPLSGAWVIELERHADERGSFARAFCEVEFAEHELPIHFPQANLSSNNEAGTLRGLHFNRAPYGEAKLVRCVRGALFDVIVDLRRDSPTRWGWFGVDLSADNGRALLIPDGFAHGFITREAATDVLYHMSRVHRPDAGRGIRWDDPSIGIGWPSVPRVISHRDATYSSIDKATFDLAE